MFTLKIGMLNNIRYILSLVNILGVQTISQFKHGRTAEFTDSVYGIILIFCAGVLQQ